MEVYRIAKPGEITSPIVLSVPHGGIQFPEEIAAAYHPELLPPDDTDWFVDQLYAFANSMGIPMIVANFSRWVIDLNRDPTGTPLYNDGRMITHLCPLTNFLGRPLYKDGRTLLTEEEIERRKQAYFDPYHEKIQEMLYESKAKFGKVLLWDCHSIRRHVHSISKEDFPDMILGSSDGNAATREVIDLAFHQLSSSTYEVRQNYMFKGGFITRYFGKPQQHQYALQLEMTKDLYMNDAETQYDEQRASKMQTVLKNTLAALTSYLQVNN